MSGDIGITIYPLALTTVIPLLIGLICYLLPNRYIRNVLVGIGVLSAIIGGLWLFFQLSSSGGVITLEIDRISLLGISFSLFELISALDFALLIGFLLIAWERRSYWAGLFALLQLIPLAWYEFMYMPSHADAHGSVAPIYIDYWSGIMCLIISIIGSLIVIYAIKYMEGQRNQNRFFAYMVGFLGAMNAAVFSNNLLWFFFFWEVTTLACYMLIKHEETEEALRNAKWALEVTLGGGTAMAFAIVWLGTMGTPVTSFTELLQASGTNIIPTMLILALAFISLAGLTKSAQVPFQSWLLGAMVAPTPVSALLHSSTMVKLGVYLFIRISPVFQHLPSLGYILAIIGGFSFMVTAILAISQNNAKKVLAYSTIGNLGLIILLAALHTPFSLTAAIVLTVFHAISKALLFLGVGVVQHETHSKEIENMDGLILRKPFITTVLLMGIMTMIIPPFGMFLGKYFAVQAGLEFPLIIFFIAVGSAATVVYYLKWIGRMINMETDAELTPEHMSILFSAPLVVMLSLAVIFSVLVAPVIQSFINPTVEVLGFPATVSSAFYGTSVITPWGYITPVFIGLFLLAVFLVPLFAHMDRKALTKVYSCGVEYPTVIGGVYFERIMGEEKLNDYVNSLGVGLIAVLIAFGVLAITMSGVI